MHIYIDPKLGTELGLALVLNYARLHFVAFIKSPFISSSLVFSLV